MIATITIIILLIILAVAIAVVKHLFFDENVKPDYYQPKKEIDDNREELEKIDKNIEIVNEKIKKNSEMDGKNETDSELLDSFKSIKL